MVCQTAVMSHFTDIRTDTERDIVARCALQTALCVTKCAVVQCRLAVASVLLNDYLLGEIRFSNGEKISCPILPCIFEQFGNFEEGV